MCKLMPLVLALVLLASCGGGSSASSGGGNTTPPPSGQVSVTLATVATGFSSPLDIEQPHDGTDRFFVVEQGGQIRILHNGSIAATPFLDISNKVTSGGETGLLGLTFHPNFSQNHRFFVNYTRTIGGQLQTVIAEYQASAANPNTADPASERILLVVNQPFSNHNAGQLAFGPDGYLYFGLGDGGNGGDPLRNGQNTQTLLGKMLRIDVNAGVGQPYAIPPDNPFVNGGGLPEIYAYGFRNPWRFSFDSSSSRLFVADVGQGAYEEVDMVEKGGNYGWNVMEGTHCFSPSSGCDMTGLTLPIHDYPHTDGISVIGGFVYHGTAIANLQSAYVFGDFGSGKIWMLRESPANTWTRTELLSTGRQISSFGQNQSGELYVVDLAGTVLQLRQMQ